MIFDRRNIEGAAATAGASPGPEGDCAHLLFGAFGGCIEVRSNDREILDWVGENLPPGAEAGADDDPDTEFTVLRVPASSDGPAQYVLSRDGASLVETPRREVLLTALEGELQFAVAATARDRVFVHAGAVSLDGGGVILVPGRSRTGKSHLVRELVQAGATYLSDEYAALDDRGQVHPFPRDIRLRTGTGVRSWQPVDHGGTVAAGPAPVSSILVTRFNAGGRWNPQRIEPSEAMLELFSNTVTARTRTALVLPVLRKAVAGSRAYRSVRGDASQVLEWLGLPIDQTERIELLS